jgi:hypothetical protein
MPAGVWPLGRKRPISGGGERADSIEGRASSYAIGQSSKEESESERDFRLGSLSARGGVVSELSGRAHRRVIAEADVEVPKTTDGQTAWSNEVLP